MRYHILLTSIHRLALLLTLLMLGGCANIARNPGYTTWAVPQGEVAPTHADPEPQTESSSPTDQEPHEAARVTPPAESNGPAGDEPEVTIRQRLDAPAPGPMLGLQRGGQDPDGLTLMVNAPETTAAGEPIPYEIVVSNRSVKGITDIVLECEFDASLEFPGSRESQVRRPLGALSVGASETVALALTPLSSGQHCVVFRVTADGLDPVEKDVCVRSEAAPVSLSLSGPTVREVNQRAEYVLTVTNESGQSLSDARIHVRYDPALAVREASAGSQQEEQSLVWDLGVLQRDERVQIQMEFECLSEKAQACVSVRATTAETAASREGCVDIVAVSSPLQVSVADDEDPVSAGDRVTYRVDVANSGPEAISDWTLELDTGEMIAVESVEVVSPAGAADETVEASNGIDVISGLPALEAGMTVTVEVRGRLESEGDAVLRAVTRSAGGDAAESSEVTVVNPPTAG